jgi:EmrB/QacA subfamily drug resistance transporter
MKQPCDEGVIRSGSPAVESRAGSEPWILAAAILGSSMAFIDGTVTNVALPALQASFHGTVVDVQWVIESYGLCLSALILTGGALGDSFGRRLMFLFGVGLFAAASAACGLSSSIGQLIAARSVQGIGAAFLVPGSLAIIGASFDERTRGRAIGTWSGFTAITTALGPVVGGWLIEHASWRWVFFINVPIAVAVLCISLRHIPETRNEASKGIDWLGSLLATISLGGLVYGFIESSRLGWLHPWVAGSLAIGSASLFGFLRAEQRSTSPLVPLYLFKSRIFSGANLLTLLLYSALGIFFFLFPLYLIQVQGYSPTATGAAALPMILILFFLSRWSGGLASRVGPRMPLMIGPLIVAGGFLMFAMFAQPNESYWRALMPAFCVLGFGMAITIAPLTTAVMSAVDRSHMGTASGINNAVARVGGVLAVAVFGVVMVSAFSHDLQRSLPRLDLSPAVMNYVEANKIKLAGLELRDLDAQTASAVRAAVTHAFIFGFRFVMMICAGLAIASSASAALMISPGGHPIGKDLENHWADSPYWLRRHWKK